MRRQIRLVLLILACAASGVGQACAAWVPSRIDMPVKQVGPHSFYVEGRLAEASRQNEGFIANAGFVIGSTGVVVFDALGSPALADRLIDEIRARTRLPIRLVVVSHYHADHFYGIAAFRAAGATIWADAKAKAYLSSEAAQQRLAERREELGPWLGGNFVLASVDRWIDHDETFEMGGLTLSLHRLGPAHSPEDLALLVQPDGVLYSGDVVYAGRVPYIGTANTRQWLDAIDRLLAIPCRVLVPGHGEASQSPRNDVERTRSYLLFVRGQMASAVANFVAFEDAYASVDWSALQAQPTFDAANRRNAYSVYLEMEQESLSR
jgi:glyoxylase-like metal-dependent hydrolase (beta-lactamase superfamily II)